MLTTALLSASLLLPAAPSEEPRPAELQEDEEEVEVLDVSECPALFGPDWAHSANNDYRSVRLYEVAITDKRVEITHGVGRWTKPSATRVAGVELLSVERPDPEPGEDQPPEDERVALVEVDEDLKDVCPPGIYALSVDDALGRKVLVLDIDDRGVLVEQEGALAFLPWEGHPLPASTRMVWRSSYDVVMDAGAASAADKGKKKKGKKKRKKRKKKKKKRKKKRKKK